MSLQDVKRVLSKLSLRRSDDQFGDWGKFAEPEDVLDFVNHLNS